MNHALDACALLAYLRAEPGGEKVAALLTDPSAVCYAHTINLVEVYYDFVRRSNVSDARRALAALRADGVIERRDIAVPLRSVSANSKHGGEFHWQIASALRLLRHSRVRW